MAVCGGPPKHACVAQTEVEVCRLAGLPDLAQENSFVRTTLLQWINNTVQQFQFDGVRIDTVAEVRCWLWLAHARRASIGALPAGWLGGGRSRRRFGRNTRRRLACTPSARWTTVTRRCGHGKLDCPASCLTNPAPQYVSPYQKVLDATLHYPMYWTLRHVRFAWALMCGSRPLTPGQVFQDKSASMTAIGPALAQYRQMFRDPSVLGMFLDNHDNPRFLNLNGSGRLILTVRLIYNSFIMLLPASATKATWSTRSRFRSLLTSVRGQRRESVCIAPLTAGLGGIFKGIPIVYYGTEQVRSLWPPAALLIRWPAAGGRGLRAATTRPTARTCGARATVTAGGCTRR